MPVYAKTIFSWVQNVLGITMAHMSPSILCWAEVFAALAAAVSLVSMLQGGDLARVSISARYYFSGYITTTDWHQDSIQ